MPPKLRSENDKLPPSLIETPVKNFYPNEEVILTVPPKVRVQSAIETWPLLLGLSAFLDFAATVLVQRLPENEDLLEEVVKRSFFIFPKKMATRIEVPDEPWFLDIVHWLDEWSVPIGILFSILWFTDAFVKANRTRSSAMREIDREFCLAAGLDSATKTTGKLLSGREETEWKRVWGPYCLTVGMQLILLPVGFYILGWRMVRIISGEDVRDEKEIDIVFRDENGNMEEEQRFTTRSNISLFFALSQYLTIVTARVTGLKLKAQLKSFGWSSVRRLCIAAVRSPRAFRRRLLRILTAVRWLKYLAPLLGACNKLFGNSMDLLKKHQQRRAAVKAQRARRLLWKKLSADERREAAAIVIQSRWRAHRARKVVKILRVIQGQNLSLAAARVQKVARGMLVRARLRLIQKRYELERLREQEQQMSRMERTPLSKEDRRRMYTLQDELNAEAKELFNRKLLMRPNTTFAVTWKILFVICIALEIAQLAWKPVLNQYRNEVTKEPMRIGQILEHRLVPTAISEWDECEDWLQKVAHKKMRSQSQKRKIPWKEESEPPAPPAPRWYCQRAPVTVQSVYIACLRFLLRETLVVVGIVCYLDVFVTFFTGEFDKDTGSLMPKPFVTRWILPGLVLQLLVNPQMETTSYYVGQLLQRIAHLGPVRVWRWAVALFWPFLQTIVLIIEEFIWIPLVYSQNSEVISNR